MLLAFILVGSSACSMPTDPTAAGQTAPAASRNPPEAASAVPTDERYAATHVLVAFAGATRAPAGITRTEEEARLRAIDVWRRREGGETLEELARRYSDDPSAVRGGVLGVYRTGTMVEEFERALAAVEVGGHTAPFRSPYGWHVARRDAVVEAEARHILITWRGAVRSQATRTKEQARARIEEALARLDRGEPFEVVAREMGEDSSAPRGGHLGVLARHQVVPGFEATLFALEPGRRSQILETAYGFHIVERIR